ncbi:amino acid ABC transporter substrate-binding protein/permease [Saccharibacillus sp. CPCC 101409]|uniref:amino acid ABC transporter substrate-binding protein/permease n=1 Tax=Saccharibacillus sp. CPCC 101409 TaxID=3058041 RepID=UPI002671392B|nr:amino acid ABC transporter substrate-binding protein/permease [Saccharibacillus sp. CPCC 101409]MDO3411343.1 amino acid ABC transporter substrate-binding protein/permease [Saccharibacillus sp. CPCC 101409]
MVLLVFLFSFAGSLAPAPVNAAGSGKTYVIGTDTTFAPFEYQDANGSFVGIDMDLIHAIADNQGFKVQIQSLGFNAALQALQSGNVDGVIAGMSITDERKKVFDFSDSYFEAGPMMGVAANNYTIESYEDLRGQRVAVKAGTEGATFAESIRGKYGFALVTFDDSSQLVDEVKAGGSAALFEDYPVLAYGIQQGNGIKTVTDKEKGGSYGFAVNKGRNPELMQMFNQGLAELKSSGQYDEIIAKYLGSADAASGADIDGEQAAPQANRLELIWQSMPAFMKGLGNTLLYTIVSLVFAFILGLIFGSMKVSHNKVLRGIATVFVDIFRGIPLLILAFFIYFAIPQAFGFKMEIWQASVLTLTLNAGAYVTEIIRGGIQSIDKGQMEAARSLGVPYANTMRKIVLPQAIKVMVPSFINQMVITLKDTSILSIIGLVELAQSGKLVIARTYQTFDVYLTIAVMYLIVITILTKIADRLERRISRG